jgi:signal transduction histidine kinase
MQLTLNFLSNMRGRFVHPIYERTVLVLVVLLCLSLVLVMWQLTRLSDRLIETAAIEGTSLYSKALNEFRELYTMEVVDRLAPLGIEAHSEYKSHQGTIPLPATLTIEFGKQLSDGESGLLVRLYSAYPFPWRTDGGPRDAYEQEALRTLNEHPDQRFVRFEEIKGKPVLRIATADRMKPSCVGCHNSHPQSPKKDWQVWDVRGVLEVVNPLENVMAQRRSGLHEIFLVMIGLTGSGLLGLSIVMQRFRRTARDLEDKVIERTVELSDAKNQLEVKVDQLQAAERQMAQQAKELARSNTELEQFAYLASHDLQEPLRMVSSFTQLLGKRYRGRLDPDADEFIHYAVDGATRMQQLIKELLTYCRVGSGSQAFVAVNCEEVLAQVFTNLRVAIEESCAEVTHGPLPSVSGNQLHLTQLFQNLISNAIKYRGEAPPRIHVSATADGGHWKLSVRDNGIGFDREAADQIFLLFGRLQAADRYPGTGIGLAICKKIVELHGGRIWAESQPGQGTTFYFTLASA